MNEKINHCIGNSLGEETTKDVGGIECLMRSMTLYIGQQGLWVQGFGKTEQKWQFMGKQLEEFFLHNMQMMRIDAHVIRIGRYIRMANPNLDIGVPYILKCEPGSIANLLFDSTFKGSWLQTRSSAVVCRCQLPIFTEFGCV